MPTNFPMVTYLLMTTKFTEPNGIADTSTDNCAHAIVNKFADANAKKSPKISYNLPKPYSCSTKLHGDLLWFFSHQKTTILAK